MASSLGKPERPLEAPTLAGTDGEINFHSMDGIEDGNDITQCQIHFPITPEFFGITREKAISENLRKGGESEAILLLQKRLAIEKKAFEKGLMLPNHANPDFINGTSLSPHLRFGMWN